ncbi:hypothetical protein P8452_66149 [Trifolium repens]|nr:hypothetical protein P8452_66149 [Trifolium repens]
MQKYLYMFLIGLLHTNFTVLNCSTSIYGCKYIFCWLVTSFDSWTKCEFERQWLPFYLIIGIFRQEGLLFVRHALFNTRKF